MQSWKLILLIILCAILFQCIFNKNIEGMVTKGNLYLILEAPGFNIPEISNNIFKIMDPSAINTFDNVVVVANAANYIKYTKKKGITINKTVMTDQWDYVNPVGKPIEKWAFVCCNTPDISADMLVNNLIKDFSDIKGFLLDTEDDPTSKEAFYAIFKKLGNKYKYSMIGGPYKSVPKIKDVSLNKFFSEMYTEGVSQQYYDIHNDGSFNCVNLKDTQNADNFWTKMDKSLGTNTDIVPTVCGAGNCQEGTPVDPSSCVDERLSSTDIAKLIINKNRNGRDFAIWYGTGQQYACEPSKTCVPYTEQECTLGKGKNAHCAWSAYKTNPITKKKGVCYGDTTATNWGCASNWN